MCSLRYPACSARAPCCYLWPAQLSQYFYTLSPKQRSSPNIFRVVKSRRMRWAGHVARVVERRGVYRLLVGKPEGRRPLGRPRRGWEDNIKMDLQELGYRGMDWIQLAQDRDRCRALVNTVMKLRVP